MGKANITERRLQLRVLAWEPLRQHLRAHIKASPFGEAKRMARACGIAASQIHRFTCDDCNHDQEPSFTIGITLALYLAQARMHPVIDIERRKNIMHEQTRLNKLRNKDRRQKIAQERLAQAVELRLRPIFNEYHVRINNLIAALQRELI